MTTYLDQAIDSRLAALLAHQPPQPTVGRFRPLRMGLLGIWEYDEQEFVFHDGRLILRGRNGSGKTKVLEVTSPFLFDADLTARRLDPFGTAARSMRDNLLFGEHTHRIGYVWCEYGRIDGAGVSNFVTIGAGLRAQRSKSGAPESWYFVTPKRVGVDFTLMDGQRNPRSRERLVEMLDAGVVFQSASQYRAAVADTLFGTTTERFRSLVELLIALRRPKLSENFGIAKLTSMLSGALPPIDNDVVDELARGFDQLAVDQEDLARIVAARAAIADFTKAYRVYARRVVRLIAGRVRSSVTAYDDVTRRKTAAERQLVDATRTRDQLRQRINNLEHEAAEQAGRVRALEQRPEIEHHGLLVQLQQQAEAAEREAAAAERRLTEATEELRRTERELVIAEKRLAELENAVAELQQSALDLADDAGLRLEHEMETERLWTDTTAAHTVLTAALTARRAAAAKIRQLRKAVDAAQLAVDKAQAACDDAMARRERVTSEVLGRRSDLEEQIEAVTRTVLSWLDDCQEISVDSEEADLLVNLVRSAGEPASATLTGRLFALAAQAQDTLLRRRAEHDARVRHAEEQHADVCAEQDRVAGEQDEAPPLPAVRRRDRTDVPGAPFWRLVDFRPDVPERDRAQVEAALLGAGLLDAWITPDGSLLDPDTFDVTLRPDAPAATGRSLTAVLTVEAEAVVPADVVGHVLGSIQLRTEPDSASDDAMEPWVSTYGAWAVGLLRGRTEGDSASYIGASARSAARARRLAELAERVALIERVLTDLNSARADIDARLARLDEERRTAPDDQLVRDGRTALDVALRQAAQAEAEVRAARQRLVARQDEARDAHEELTTYAEARDIDPSEARLDALESALGSYRDAVTDLITRVRSTVDQRFATATSRDRVLRQGKSHERQQEETRDATDNAIEMRAAYLTRHEMVGAGVEQVLVELRTARERQSELQQEQKSATVDLTSAAETVGKAESELRTVEETRTEQETVRAAAIAEFERLRGHKLLDLIDMMGVAAESGTMTRTIDEARRAEHLLHDEDITDRSRNLARNNVDDQFRELQRAIGSADWRPWGEHDGDLFLVRVTHNGIDHDVLHMMEVLDAEISTRRGLLDEHERDLFGKVLVGKVGQHLRRCRREARSLVDRMNDLLRERPTASGLLMFLEWEVDPEAGGEAERAVALLDGQAPDYLSDDRRAELIDFLVSQVRRVRDEQAGADWKTALREALDYRNWCRFRIRVKKAGGAWSDLTDGKHQQGSGGEKAIMLQLPLFVAAAAHYQAVAATAPRPVYLDEAFAGIDQEMRGSCMGLLTDLDLDFVMASHDEWGFHTEVPGVVTYQLMRDPDEATVLATPFLWDGERDYRLVDPTINGGSATLFDRT